MLFSVTALMSTVIRRISGVVRMRSFARKLVDMICGTSEDAGIAKEFYNQFMQSWRLRRLILWVMNGLDTDQQANHHDALSSSDFDAPVLVTVELCSRCIIYPYLRNSVHEPYDSGAKSPTSCPRRGGRTTAK